MQRAVQRFTLKYALFSSFSNLESSSRLVIQLPQLDSRSRKCKQWGPLIAWILIESFNAYESLFWVKMTFQSILFSRFKNCRSSSIKCVHFFARSVERIPFFSSPLKSAKPLCKSLHSLYDAPLRHSKEPNTLKFKAFKNFWNKGKIREQSDLFWGIIMMYKIMHGYHW